MHSLLTLFCVSLCAVLTLGITLGKQSVGKCHYYMDPHLTPFPSAPGVTQSQYLCMNNCTEILVKNQFVELIVTPGPNGFYPIVAYTLIFFPTEPFPYPCVITDSISSPSSLSSLNCPSSTPGASTLSPTHQLHSHLTQIISIDIYNMGSHFNILITQSFPLIAQSTGVCVKWDCVKERKSDIVPRRKRETNALIGDICNIFINEGKRRSFHEVNEDFVKSLYTACVHDVEATYDLRYAQGMVGLMIRESVPAEENSNLDALKEYAEKGDAIAQEGIQTAQNEANELIKTSSPLCREVGSSKQCLEPLPIP